MTLLEMMQEGHPAETELALLEFEKVHSEKF